MEIGTTSISELPITQNKPNISGEENLENMNMSTENLVMDDKVLNSYENS
jgi:hypothetical protein